MKAALLLLVFTLWVTNTTAQFNETDRFVASDRTTNSELGIDVAIDGNFAVGGAYRDNFDANGANPLNEAGSAYIFENDGNGNWSQIQKLVASDREPFAAFGISVAISGDYIVVGAQLEDKSATGGDPINNAGAAYIYERQGDGTWEQVQKIVSSTRISAGSFGISVKIEGTSILIGSNFDSTDENGNNNAPQAGAAFFFERDGSGTWNQTQKIVASDRGSGDNFGVDVAFTGNDAVIGANFDSQDGNGTTVNNSGTAYIFEKDGGGMWIQSQKIVGSDRGTNDRFGEDVAIDGDLIVIGARLQETDANGNNSIIDAGAAYIFERNGGGTWNEIKKIVADDRAQTDVFGFSVSIDGNYAAVGARLNDFDASGGNFQTNAGAAYVFEQNTGGTDNWGQVQKIVTSDRGIEDRFAHELVLKDGILLSASPGQDQDAAGNNTIANAGMLYVFTNPTLTVTENDFGIGFTAYPNPFRERVNIHLGNTTTSGEVRVSTLEGRLVYAQSFENRTSLEIPLTVASGAYLIKITTVTGNAATLKVLKN